MAVRLSQANINKAKETYVAGTQLYDTEISSLKVVIAKQTFS
jgi:hypothetical protein